MPSIRLIDPKAGQAYGIDGYRHHAIHGNEPQTEICRRVDVKSTRQRPASVDVGELSSFQREKVAWGGSKQKSLAIPDPFIPGFSRREKEHITLTITCEHRAGFIVCSAEGEK